MTFGSPSADRDRSRACILVPPAVAAWAVLEIWLLTVVAGALGGGMVLLLLLAGGVCGAAAVKRAGRRAWQRLAASLQAGGDDGRGSEATGAGLAMLGGLLLIVPGFSSDAAGLLCLFPPTRKLLVGVAAQVLARRRPRPGWLGHGFQQVRIHRPDGKVVQGEVIRDDERAGHPPTDSADVMTREPLDP